MNTKVIGNLTEAMLLAKLLKIGKIVNMPFGDNQRYDLLIDEGSRVFSRVQCKTGNLKNGVITFATSSSYAHRGGKRKSYVDEIEYFGVYCPSNGESYLVPIGHCCEGFTGLRIEPTKNNQTVGVKFAKDYLI